MLTQIYGVTCAEDARVVNRLGPDHVGVVLDEGIDTWDSVDLPTMGAILASLTSVKVVALSLSTEVDRITATVADVRPHIVHLARAVDGFTPQSLSRLARQIAPVQIMTTIPVRDDGALDLARAFAPCSDYLLLDTAHPVTGVVGASGHAHDWSISARVVAAVDVPVILAGGLGPDNVAAAIRAVAPAGVDSETRTSRDDDRRRKDPAKVRAFLERARA